MQRSKKLTTIKTLLNEIQKKKEFHLCDKYFYSDMVHLYEDEGHTIRVNETDAEAYCEAEKIKHNAVICNYITICTKK